MALRREDFARHSRPILRTRRWKVLRQIILERDEWKCCNCGSLKRLEVDHIQPVRHAPDRAFDPANLQVLCASCHTHKTRIELGHKPITPARREWRSAVAALDASGTFSVPFGQRPSRIPVTIVCGPPGAGKTTFVRAHAAPSDVVIDFDDFLEEVGGVMWDRDRAKVQAAFKLRNQALRSLSEQSRGRAWLILTAPTRAEREAWKAALRRVTFIIMAVEPDVCKARIQSDPKRQHALSQMIEGVDRWWSDF